MIEIECNNCATITKLYTSDEIAAMLDITPRMARKLPTRYGVGVKVGRDWLFTEAEAESLRKRNPPGRPKGSTDTLKVGDLVWFKGYAIQKPKGYVFVVPVGMEGVVASTDEAEPPFTIGVDFKLPLVDDTGITWEPTPENPKLRQYFNPAELERIKSCPNVPTK